MQFLIVNVMAEKGNVNNDPSDKGQEKGGC